MQNFQHNFERKWSFISPLSILINVASNSCVYCTISIEMVVTVLQKNKNKMSSKILLACKTSTVCYCHFTYAFQSESTLYRCLNVKELLARNKCDIWSLIDCNRTRTYNHLVHKRTLNHLAKLASLAKCLSVRLWIKGCGFESRCSHCKTSVCSAFIEILSTNRTILFT